MSLEGDVVLCRSLRTFSSAVTVGLGVFKISAAQYCDCGFGCRGGCICRHVERLGPSSEPHGSEASSDHDRADGGRLLQASLPRILQPLALVLRASDTIIRVGARPSCGRALYLWGRSASKY